MADIKQTKITDLNSACTVLKFRAGQVIYEINSVPQNCYVVQEGSVAMETCIEIDRYHRFPISHDEWEVRKVTKRYVYKLATLR